MSDPFVPRPGRGRLFIDAEAKLTAALRGLGLNRREANRSIAATLEWLNGATDAKDLFEGIGKYPLHLRPEPDREPIGPLRPPMNQRSAGDSPGGRRDPLPRLPVANARRAAAAAIAERKRLGGAFADILQTAGIPELDEVALAQLIHVGGSLTAGLPPGPLVGVLLPMRLETRFFAPDMGHSEWIMRLRVIPDALSVDRHRPVPTAAELDGLETMWANAADLSTLIGQAQWRRFAMQFGAGRAAWLARTFPPVIGPGGTITITRPAEARQDFATSQLAGLPAAFEVWLARGGARPVLAKTLPIDHARLALDFPDPATGESRWWTSFAEAKDVGMGTEIALGGTRPDDIDAVYVVGLGDDQPVGLFMNHRDSGQLGILRPGTPTNTVAGTPAADLAKDPEMWRQLLLSPPPQPGTEVLSEMLTGDPDALSPLPGGDFGDSGANQAMVTALWPVLWGHQLKDVWGLGDRAFGLGAWVSENLRPEGPVPAVRIGDQPYGILPATSLARWAAHPGDPEIEPGMVRMLRDLRARWANAAELGGTTEGADTERLLELIGQLPASTAYSWRYQIPLETLSALTQALDGGVPWASLRTWWDEMAKPVTSIAGDPTRRYVALGWVQDLDLPLVEPDNLPDGMGFREAIHRILDTPPSVFASERGLREIFPVMPDSLLLRLLIQSLAVSAADAARWAKDEHGPLLDPPWFPDDTPPLISMWGSTHSPALPPSPATEQLDRTRWAIDQLAGIDPTTLDRVLRATLDTAMYRIDPWIVGLADRRLRTLNAANPGPRYRLGAYGWVDAPRPRGDTAPPDEFFHAPSEAQALTTAILRDRALNDGDGKWMIDLDSDGVRGAKELASEVGAGAHLSEALGRAVERVVGDRATIDRLRTSFPIRTEHSGRRTLDGQAVIERFQTAPDTLLLDAGRLEGIRVIAEALDTYGDLLVADAVHEVVSGRASLAGAAMEAAAGLGNPPELEVIRTQRSGRAIGTTVLIALSPGAPQAAVGPQSSPGQLAEPAVADALVALTGASSAWQWTVKDAAGNPHGTVTLADLGLEPIDTLSLTPADLVVAVLAHLEGDYVDPEALDQHSQARRLADILGTQPALPADLVTGGAPTSAAAVEAEMLARYTAVHALAVSAHAAIAGAQTGSESAQRSALADALRWGITPMTADEPALAVMVARAAEALAHRIGAAPVPADAAGTALTTLARALAELVAPGGRLPVLSRLPLNALPAAGAEPPAAGLSIDSDWLEVVAAVRTPLARLEAFQRKRELRGEEPLAAWSTSPGDPWQTTTPSADDAGFLPATRLFAIFGTPGALDPGGQPDRPIALGVLDSWSEVVPGTDHTTTTAFHFDAPAARAAQAVIVAVPPDPTVELDAATLVDIVVETRELAHARAGSPADFDPWSAGAPTTVLPANEPGAVSLDRA